VYEWAFAAVARMFTKRARWSCHSVARISEASQVQAERVQFLVDRGDDSQEGGRERVILANARYRRVRGKGRISRGDRVIWPDTKRWV